MKNKIKRILNYVAAPFKDKIELQKRANTAELKRAEMEAIFNTYTNKAFYDAFFNIQEIARLKEENKKLRSKVKELKRDLRGNK